MSAIIRKPRLGAISVLAALAVLACAVSATGAAWGRHRQDLRTDGRSGEYGVFTLNKPVYMHARGDLADLRVIDGEGGLVPMAIVPAASAPPEERWGSVFNQVFHDNEGQVSLDLGAEEIHHESLSLAFSGAEFFVLRVAMEGSDNNRDWGTMAEGLLLARLEAADGEVVEIKRLSYPPSRFSYIRLRYRELLHGAKMHLTSASWGMIPGKGLALTVWPAEFRSEPERAERRQSVRLDLGCRLPVQEITLSIATRSFHRDVILESSADGEDWQYIAEDSIFRCQVAGAVVERTGLSFPAQREARFYRFRIVQGDDQPLEISGAEARGRFDRVVFATTSGGRYKLAYGVELAEPAQYDLAALYNRLPAESFTEWQLSGMEESQGGAWPSWLFYLGLGVGMLVLAGAAILALRKVNAPAGE